MFLFTFASMITRKLLIEYVAYISTGQFWSRTYS